MIQIILIAITVVSIPCTAYLLYLTNDPNYENIVKNTIELTKSEYLDKIMSMGIDFPKDTRIIYENKDFTEGRFPELSDWAFFSKMRIHIPNEKQNGPEKVNGKIKMSCRERTIRSFGVFKKMIKDGNSSIKIESFKPDDISFLSFWDIGATEYRGKVYTSNGASILQLERIGKKVTGGHGNPTDQ